MTALVSALTLQAGYNAALVMIGAALLGAAAGIVGTFLVLRRRALVSDAVSHATLPGVALAFMVMVTAGGDGRHLAGLLTGAALSAGIGLLIVQWLTNRTRLNEDAAIGAVLAVFFGFGIVLMTVIQGMPGGRQAGLQSFLLGSTAGMLFQDAMLIGVGGALAVVSALALRRVFALAAFDPGFATVSGVSVRQADMSLMALALGVTIAGMKIVGLILIVALLIIPAAAARFWSERVAIITPVAALIGATSAYVGAAISAAAPGVPTGPVIVLCAFAIFLFSLLFAPARGAIAKLIQFRTFQRQVHLRQGLLALARAEPVRDDFTLKVLRRAGFIRRDGVATTAGQAASARASWDEKRCETARRLHPEQAVSGQLDGLTPISAILTSDQIAAIDRMIGAPRAVSGA